MHLQEVKTEETEITQAINQIDGFIGKRNFFLASFLKKLLNLHGSSLELEDCLSWSRKIIQEINQSVQNQELYQNFSCNVPCFKQALVLSYFLHFGQTRKRGADIKYIEHPVESIKIWIQDLVREKEAFSEKKERKEENETIIEKIPGIIISQQKFINSLIKLVLHDGPEDVLDNLEKQKKILPYYGFTQEFPESETKEVLTLEAKEEFYQELINVLENIFPKNVVYSLLYVFTKFSKRIFTAESLKRIKKELFSKEDVGRGDFVVRNFSIRDPEDLRLIWSEKRHNLGTKQEMSDSKFLEYFNLGVSLMAAGFRDAAKTLFNETFRDYLELWRPVAAKRFYEKLQTKRSADQEYLNSCKTSIQEALDNLYGENNYEFCFEELDDWRVHEIVMRQYFSVQNKPYFNLEEDELTHFFVSEAVMADSTFEAIFSKIPMYRVKVTLPDEADHTYHQNRHKLAKLKGFKVVDGSKVDYCDEVPGSYLKLTNYKALCFATTPLETERNETTNIQFKVVLNKYDLRNEYGIFTTKSGEDGRGVKEFTSQSIQDFLQDMKKHGVLNSKEFLVFEELAKKRLGINLATDEEVLTVNDPFSDYDVELGGNVVLQTIVEVVQKVKKLLHLDAFIEKGFIEASK